MFPKAGTLPGAYRGRDYAFVLPQGLWTENFGPQLARRAILYGDRWGLRWHDAKHHLLSSQICCFNHLLPFAIEPKALAHLLEPVFGAELEMLPIPGDGLYGEPCYVAFEYFGPLHSDFLSEGGGKPLTRGANCTSVDAAVLFRRAGQTELVLIEWKYTEAYGDRTPDQADIVRERRYRPLVEGDGGLLKAEVDIPFKRLLVAPFYQFLRQQLLAREMERVRLFDADVVRVLHLSPRQNKAFAKIPVAEFRPYGTNATEAWSNVLAKPDRFLAIAIEDVFGRALHPEVAELLSYAGRRYAFTSDSPRARRSEATTRPGEPKRPL